MIKTLRESKAKLSSLVERASRGEDVFITVRGQVKARLTKAEPPQSSQLGVAWVEELRALQRSMRARPKSRLPVERILAEDREDRF